MRGLARNNNLSDLTNPIQARTNLGLSTADYNRIQGLWAVSGFSNLRLQRIAGSTGNYQNQINYANTTLAGINTALYANRSGDTLTGTWSNTGRITAGSLVVNGVTLSPSTDSLFTQNSGSFNLSATQFISMSSGLTVDGLVSDGAVTVSTLKPIANALTISINGVPYKLETT